MKMIFNNTKFQETVRSKSSQFDLGLKIGKRQGDISRILRQGENMKVTNFLLICECLNLDPSQFMMEVTDDSPRRRI